MSRRPCLPSRNPALEWPFRLGLWLLPVLLSGCVTVYQPLVGLQRPVAIDPQLANFEGMRLGVRCAPGDYLKAADADLLCRAVSTLFRRQGAQVEVLRGRASVGEEKGATRPDLLIDLNARLLNQEDNSWLAPVAGLTWTLVPTMSEFSFAQDVTIRDKEGFLLASDSLQGRFIEYIGVGVWSVNWVLDLTVRDDKDELTGDVAKRDFSRDFYNQLSQLVFNASMRSKVMNSFEVEPVPQPSSN